MPPRSIRLAVTLGDVNGIGPEIALKAIYKKRWPAGVRFILVGAPAVVAATAEDLGLPTPPEVAEPGRTLPRVSVWDPAPELRLTPRPGRVHASAGRAACRWIEAAVEGCMDGRFHGIVTAPISKEAIHKAGSTFPGHTEMLARLSRTKSFAMMLLGGPLRVVLATRHIPLAEVPAALKPALLRECITLTHDALPWLGLRRGRVAVCGLNPHAGEGGHIGKEEQKVINPLLQRLRREGLSIEGPLPGDTVFFEAAGGAYDAVVAMYHDQGLGPLKTLAFDRGVNLTLGLPFVRTSPDHGTAFGLARQNKANPRSMVEAIKLAVELARRKNPWR